MKIKFRVTALVAGSIIGFAAAFGQAFLGILPPETYGVCLIGHPRDLINWIVNYFFTTNFYVSPVSIAFPVMTAVGVIIGARVAAMRNKEFKLEIRAEPDPISAFMFGFMVAQFGLLWGLCPLRTLVSVAYGDPISSIAFVLMAIGVVLATNYIRWRAKKR